ncbi:MAG: hypothetical protein Q9207_000012 [Kuettlingeria erythrocarpa]
MLVEALISLQHAVGSAASSPLGAVAFALTYMTGIFYLLWRSLTFTILPILRPKDPRQLLYWIPGHAMPLIKDAQALIAYGKYDRNEPFAMTVAGRTIYVATAAEDIAAIYRNNTTLSWDAMLDELLVGFGVRSSVIPKLWQKPSAPGPYDCAEGGKKGLSIVHTTLDLYKRQLLPGAKFDTFSEVLLGRIDEWLSWNRVQQRYGTAGRLIPLKDLCTEVLVDVTTRTLFGDGLVEVEANIVRHFLDFNNDAWMLVFQYPQKKGSKLMTARRRILDALVNYLEGSDEIRMGRSWLVEKVTERLEFEGIGSEDIAALLLMVYWAANINPYRLGFWMMAYILFNPALLNTLRAETKCAVSDKIDANYLVNNCPHLEALYLEVMRIVNGALSARKIVADTPMGTKILRKGNTILIPFQQLHRDKNAFGPDPAAFEPERFLLDKSLRNSASYKPFGGGVNYCPGRFLAKQEMLVFVALLINRFDFEIPPTLSKSRSSYQPQSFPELDNSTPALGVNGPVPGMDVYVSIRRRAG